jgi:hypothetical protein
MDNKEAIKAFKQAKRLYKTGHYQEALDCLADLNSRFPDNFNILHPMLMCHEKLGHKNDAYELCGQMLQRFIGTQERAKLFRIYGRLSRQGLAQAGHVNDHVGATVEPANERLIVLPDASGIIQIAGYWIAWRRLLLAWVVIGTAIVGLLLIPLMIDKVNPRGSTNEEVLFLALAVFHFYLWNCFACYVALWASNNLVHEDLLWNILDAFLFVPVLVPAVLDSFLLMWTDSTVMDRYNMSSKETMGFYLTIILFNAAYIYVLWESKTGKEIFQLLS